MEQSAYPQSITTTPPARRPLLPTLYIIIGIVGVLALATLAMVGVVWLARSFPTEIEAVRDILIIAFALESCLFGIVLMMLLVMVIRLVNMLEFEIKPILEKTNETVGMVRGTSTFVSRNVVGPTISARTYLAGFRTAVRTLLGDPRRNLDE